MIPRTVAQAQKHFNIKLDAPPDMSIADYLEGIGYPSLASILREEFDRHSKTINGIKYVPFEKIRRTLR